jgi:hypothetical protein
MDSTSFLRYVSAAVNSVHAWSEQMRRRKGGVGVHATHHTMQSVSCKVVKLVTGAGQRVLHMVDNALLDGQHDILAVRVCSSEQRACMG